MRLTFVINSLAAGGAQRVVTDLMALLVARGHDVTLVTYSRKDRDHFRLPPDVTRIELDLLWNSRNFLHAIGSNLRRLKLLRDAVLQTKPDAVVSFIDLTNIMTLVSMFGSHVPVVVSERIHPKFYEIGWQWRLARRLTYFLCAALVVQTREIAEWAGTVVPRAKISVIPNAAPLVDPTDSSIGREKIILAVGRLNVQKGFDLLLRAFAESGVWSEGWRVVIVGEGPERSSLTGLAKQLGLLAHIDMPGEVNAVEGWYRRCGIFILSSRYEGFPNVLLEAMAHGCASIAYDCPSGPRDIVESGRNGLLLPASNVSSLVAAIRQLCGDEQLRSRFSAAAREVPSRFSQNAIVERWECLLVQVASCQ